jgi:hypothetical protein
MTDQEFQTQQEILARLIRIESKLSAFMEAQGLDTHGQPVTKDVEKQPMSNAPRDPFGRTYGDHKGYRVRN